MPTGSDVQGRREQGISGSGLSVVRVDHRHTGTLAEFIRQVWDPTATPEAVGRARAEAATLNPGAFGQEAPTFLFLANGQAVGHLSTLPIRLCIGQTEQPAHWMTGFWVLTQHQNGPVGFLLLKEAVRHLGYALSLTVQPASRRLFEALGFKNLGMLPNFLQIIRPATILQNVDLTAIGLAGLPRWLAPGVRMAQRQSIATVAGAVASGAAHIWTAALGRPSRSFEVKRPQEVNVAEYDDLWSRIRPAIAATPTRDGTYLRWRYGSGGDGRYQFVTVHAGSTLWGFAAVRRPRTEGDSRLSGIRVATLSEATFPPDRPEVGLALLAAVEGAARDLEADALLCSPSHAALPPLLRRRGFLRLPGNLHFLIRDPKGNLPLPRGLAEWWLMRGDMNADEVF